MGFIEWLKLQILKILGRSRPAILGVIALAWIGFLIETIKVLSTVGDAALLIPFVIVFGSLPLMFIVAAIMRVDSKS